MWVCCTKAPYGRHTLQYLIDAILMHWEKNSGSQRAWGGFKLTSRRGDAGGEAEAVIWSIQIATGSRHALISYGFSERKGINCSHLAEAMADGGLYAQMTAKTYNITYDGNGSAATGTEP